MSGGCAGVLKAVKNGEQLAEAIKGMDPPDQEAIDKKASQSGPAAPARTSRRRLE